MDYSGLISDEFPEALANRRFDRADANRANGQTGQSAAVAAAATRNEINLLILNYLIYEGYVNAARDFADELGLQCVVNQLKDVPEATPVDTAVDGEFDDGYNDSELDGEDLDEKYFDVDEFFSPDALEKDINDAYKEVMSGSGLPALSVDKYDRLTAGLSTIQTRNAIKVLILEGKVAPAIDQINRDFPSLLEKNQYLYFKLLHLGLIERIRTHFQQRQQKEASADAAEDHGDDEADREFLNEVLEFIGSKLSGPNVLQSKKFLKELELTMALLCFGDRFKAGNASGGGSSSSSGSGSGVPKKLRALMDVKLRSEVANLANKSIIIHTNPIELATVSMQDNDEAETKSYEVKATDFDKERGKKVIAAEDIEAMRRSEEDGEDGMSVTSDQSTADAGATKLRNVETELETLEKRLEKPEGVKLLRLVKYWIWSRIQDDPEDISSGSLSKADQARKLEEAIKSVL